jgi:hypothetical protein
MGIEIRKSMSRKTQKRCARKLGMPLKLWEKKGSAGQTAAHAAKAKADRIHSVRVRRSARKLAREAEAARIAEERRNALAKAMAEARQEALIDRHSAKPL